MPRQLTVTEALDEYAEWMQSQGLAENSVISFRGSAKLLDQMYGHKKIANITYAQVTQYLNDLSKRRGPSSMVLANTHMRTFFRYCVDSGQLKPTANPMTNRKAPRVVKKEKLRIPFHRYPEMLHIADQRDARDRAVIAVGLFTLLRDQEMASLRIRDIDLQAGTVRARITKSYLEDLLPIVGDLDVELRRWYKHYQSHVGALHPEYFLLPKLKRVPRRDPLTGRLMRGSVATYEPNEPFAQGAKIVTPLIEKMGYPIADEDGRSLRHGAHTLRRSGARSMYDKLVADGRADAIRVVQKMAHHKTQEQTEDYIGLELDRATRDELLRGVMLYDFDSMPTIGLGDSDGRTQSYGS